MAKDRSLAARIFDPITELLKDSRAIGIILLLCTLLSMVIANTGQGNNYTALINTVFHFPSWLHLPHTLLHWINDGGMALFFFLVGMEIKRELLAGELSAFKKAILPVAAAVGGMLVPALIYITFNSNNEYVNGWGIPMATDIAFSLGILAIIGSRVPPSLKIFLMALAIIDDLGAILVIAFFYGGQLQLTYLLLAGGIVVLMLLLHWLKLRQAIFIIIGGLALWYTVFNSGIHPTIAGVVIAMFVPVDKLPKYEHLLHPVVNFMVLPLFALANTAIILPANATSSLAGPLSLGILGGLVLGKPIGIFLFSWLMVKLKLGTKPSGSNWLQIAGVGILAGIGFTMSIFIALLAFTAPASQDIAKLSVLAASLLAAVAGMVLLRLSPSSANV